MKNDIRLAASINCRQGRRRGNGVSPGTGGQVLLHPHASFLAGSRPDEGADGPEDHGGAILGGDKNVFWSKITDVMDVQAARMRAKMLDRDAARRNAARARRAEVGAPARSEDEYSSDEDSSEFEGAERMDGGTRPPAWRHGASSSIETLTESTSEIRRAERAAEKRRALVRRQLLVGQALQPQELSPRRDQSQRNVVRSIERALVQMQSQRRELRHIIQTVERDPTVCTDHRRVDIARAANIIAFGGDAWGSPPVSR